MRMNQITKVYDDVVLNLISSLDIDLDDDYMSCSGSLLANPAASYGCWPFHTQYYPDDSIIQRIIVSWLDIAFVLSRDSVSKG